MAIRYDANATGWLVLNWPWKMNSASARVYAGGSDRMTSGSMKSFQAQRQDFGQWARGAAAVAIQNSLLGPTR